VLITLSWQINKAKAAPKYHVISMHAPSSQEKKHFWLSFRDRRPNRNYCNLKTP